jgi:preprotein translocase subunit YajC
MDFFISPAFAQTAEQANPWVSLLPLVLIFVVFYFLLIRPQQKRAKEHRQMVEALKVGDEVVTSAGIAGVISKIGESFHEIQIADNTTVKVQKHAVGTVLPKGTLDQA